MTNGINLSTSALETKMALMVNSAIKKCDYVCARALCGSLSADRMICDVILGRYECEKGD